MSSLKPSVASDAAVADGLFAACASVAEQCLYGVADCCGEAAFAGYEPFDADGWLRAIVSFTGVVHGEVALTVRAASAREWCAGFAGLAPDDPLTEQQVWDFAAEMANMTCGAWLTHWSGNELFALEPAVIEPLPEGAPAPEPPGGCVQHLLINDVPVRVAARVHDDRERS
jgi:hypothetical protein